MFLEATLIEVSTIFIMNEGKQDTGSDKLKRELRKTPDVPGFLMSWTRITDILTYN